jgi:hypothetical protein
MGEVEDVEEEEEMCQGARNLSLGNVLSVVQETTTRMLVLL